MAKKMTEIEYRISRPGFFTKAGVVKCAHKGCKRKIERRYSSKCEEHRKSVRKLTDEDRRLLELA